MDLPLAWLVTFRHVFFGNVFSRHYPSGEYVEREREKGVLRGEYKDVSLSKTVCTTNGPKKKYHQVPVRFQIYRLGYKNDLISKNVKV